MYIVLKGHGEKENDIYPRLAIVFPVYNCLNYTIKAINSLFCNEYYYLIIVDNASTDGTREWCKNYKEKENQKFIYIRNKENKGVAGGWNIGAKKAIELNVKYILISNNDVLFHHKTIDNMIDSLEKHSDWGLVSANNKRAELQTPEKIIDLEIPEESFSENPDFACFMLRASVYNKIGDFDENFKGGYFEDNDYHYRLKKAGILAVSTTLAPYYHYGSRTQNQIPGGVINSYQFIANRNYYIKKHGGEPGKETK